MKLKPTYDDKQLGARWVSWLCCRHTVIATDPNHRGCASCQRDQERAT